MVKNPRLNVALDDNTMAKFQKLCRSQNVSLSLAVRALVVKAIREKTKFQIALLPERDHPLKDES